MSDVTTTDDLEALLLDLIEWVGEEPKPYFEVMEAWRTSCPRLPVWEEAMDRGFLARLSGADNQPVVQVTPLGKRFLSERRRR